MSEPPPGSTPVIQAREVGLNLNGAPFLEDLSLTVHEKRLAVIGRNGSGKSTFARLLNGLLLPDKGGVEVFGLDTRAHTREVRRLVGFLFQNPEHQILFPTVAEDIEFGLRNLGLEDDQLAARVSSTLDQLGLVDLQDRSTYTLSGGEKQLLALAAVLAMKPRLIVFDEPTTLLDLHNKGVVMRIVDALDQAVVFVTHDLELARCFERVLVFEQGSIVADDRPEAAIDFYVRHFS